MFCFFLQKTVAYVDAFTENETEDLSFCDKSPEEDFVNVSEDNPDADVAVESIKPCDVKLLESLCDITDVETSQATKNSDVVDVCDEGNSDEQVAAGSDKKRADYYYFYQGM